MATVDLTEQTTTHDACPLARTAALNARKVAKPGDKYILGKPSEHQKIDVLMADILAHEAASDMRAAGWPGQSTPLELGVASYVQRYLSQPDPYR